MRNEFKWTTNSALYKKLARLKHIDCTWCKPNRGCNSSSKSYGGMEKGENTVFKFPSWKLATKNRKQWESKPRCYKIERSELKSCPGKFWVEIHFGLQK